MLRATQDWPALEAVAFDTVHSAPAPFDSLERAAGNLLPCSPAIAGSSAWRPAW